MLRPPRFHPAVHFFSVSALLSNRRGPCRSEAPSTARAAPLDHEPLIVHGWTSLGSNVARSFCGWTYRQGTPIESLLQSVIDNQGSPDQKTCPSVYWGNILASRVITYLCRSCKCDTVRMCQVCRCKCVQLRKRTWKKTIKSRGCQKTHNKPEEYILIITFQITKNKSKKRRRANSRKSHLIHE